MNQAEQKLEELGASFDEQFSQFSGRVMEKTKELHDREKIYRDTEDKLIQMIAEYRELVDLDEAAKSTSV